MGVFSVGREPVSRDVRVLREQPRVKPRQKRSTEGLVRDAWQAAPYSGREASESPFEPVRGVSLELFAEVAKAVAARDDSHALGTELAQMLGVEANDWLFACRTWNNRIADNPAVARQLSSLYGDADDPRILTA